MLPRGYLSHFEPSARYSFWSISMVRHPASYGSTAVLSLTFCLIFLVFIDEGRTTTFPSLTARMVAFSGNTLNPNSGPLLYHGPCSYYSPYHTSEYSCSRLYSQVCPPIIHNLFLNAWAENHPRGLNISEAGIDNFPRV